MENAVIIEEKDVFESADFDELAELKALVRSIKRAESFSLLFARCNQRPSQIELQKKVAEELPDKKITVIYFENAVENLLDELRGRLKDENPDAVFVYGLESSMPDSKTAHQTPFVKNLNATRNGFPKVIDRPLVFWLPNYAISAIMNGAPDFFSVRSGVFFFQTDSKLVAQQISEAFSLGYSEHNALLLEEREQRIKNLEELLKEYESLPEIERDAETEYQLKNRLADILYKTGNYGQARKIRIELLENYSAEGERKAFLLNELGLIYNSQGKYEKAIKLYKEALRIDEKTIGKEHPQYATRLNNLAIVYKSQGKYEEAIELYKEALLIGEKTIGKEHPNYATRLNNLANVYWLQGKYDDAIELYKESLRIDEKTIGKEHPDYAIHLSNLANVYWSQKKYDEAMKLYKEALLIGKKTIGKEHPSYAIRLSSLALVYKSQGKYDEAIELNKEALRIGEKTIGKEHPEYATRLNNLAKVYDSQGKYDKAVKLYEQAVAIVEKVLPENHPKTKLFQTNLAECLIKSGKK